MDQHSEVVTDLQKSKIPYGWLRALLYVIAWIVIYSGFQIFGFGLISMFTGEDLFEMAEMSTSDDGLVFLIISQAFGLLGTLLVTYLFRVYIDKKSFMSLGFKWQNYQKDALYGFGLGFLLIGTGFFVLFALGMLKVDGLDFSPLNLLLYFIVMCVVAVNEEIVDRGYVLTNLMDSTNKYVALLISAVFFAVLHGTNPNMSWIAFFNIFLAGILLGTYYIHVGNLWFPIMLHLSWNYFQGPVFGFEVSGIDINGLVWQTVSGNDLLTGGDFGFEGSLLSTLLSIIAIAFIEIKYGKKDRKALMA